MIRYVIRIPKPNQHWIEVDATFPTAGLKSIELRMAAWTPGSYLVRDYARNVESISAFDTHSQSSLSIEKQSKDVWIADCEGFESITCRYILYCRELSVRTNWIEDEYGFLTGAATFLYCEQLRSMPHEIQIEAPIQWPSIACSLPVNLSDTSNHFGTKHLEANSAPESSEDLTTWECFHRIAKDFDQVVDSPILMGDLSMREFDVCGRTHYLSSVLTNGAWDMDKATVDVAKIVHTVQQFWVEIPYEKYWFLNIAADIYGGLEHDDNTVLMTSRWAMKRRDTYLQWLGLVCHEFFHTWNVRRLRPRELMNYRYSGEQYVKELWIAEGITSYYDDLLLMRAGMCSEQEYLDMLLKTIQTVQDAPGRLNQSLVDSSFDAWIKLYRPDENAINSRISYYTKGAVVAFLLDMRIRSFTNNTKSLDDVVQELWIQFRAPGYELIDFETLASKIAGCDLSDWFERHVRMASEIDFKPAFEWLGLTFDGNDTSPQPQTPSSVVPLQSLGCEFTVKEGRLTISKVVRDGPSSIAGLNVDDEWIAVNGYRILNESQLDRIVNSAERNPIQITYARRQKLQTAMLTTRPTVPRTLRTITQSSEQQKTNLAAWLGSDVR